MDGVKGGDQVILAYYLGDKQYVKDTVLADNKGAFQFSYPELLDQGIYLLVFPADSNKYMEFIVDADQQFDMTAKLSDFARTALFKGSAENTLFYSYLKKITAFKKEAVGMNAEQLAALDKKVMTEQNQLIQKYPSSFTVKLLQWQKRPEIPTSITDKTERYYYYKARIFDDKDWNFTPITRTPAYHAFLMEYIDNLTVQTPDSLVVACDELLTKSKQNKDLFKYTLITLTNKFATNNTVCFDNVYFHLVDQYYAIGRAFWMTEPGDLDNLKRMKARAEGIRYIRCGQPVFDFTLQDDKGVNHTLYAIESPYTMLMFWSTDCGHCEEAIKKMVNLDALFVKKGVKLVTVADGTNRELWLKKMATFPIKSTLSLMSTNSDVVHTLIEKYDFYTTPAFFLVDKDKTLLYKRFDAKDIKELLESLPDK